MAAVAYYRSWAGQDQLWLKKDFNKDFCKYDLSFLQKLLIITLKKPW